MRRPGATATARCLFDSLLKIGAGGTASLAVQRYVRTMSRPYATALLAFYLPSVLGAVVIVGTRCI